MTCSHSSGCVEKSLAGACQAAQRRRAGREFLEIALIPHPPVFWCKSAQLPENAGLEKTRVMKKGARARIMLQMMDGYCEQDFACTRLKREAGWRILLAEEGGVALRPQLVRKAQYTYGSILNSYREVKKENVPSGVMKRPTEELSYLPQSYQGRIRSRVLWP